MGGQVTVPAPQPARQSLHVSLILCKLRLYVLALDTQEKSGTHTLSIIIHTTLKGSTLRADCEHISVNFLVMFSLSRSLKST
jgi:hypothetical protein